MERIEETLQRIYMENRDAASLMVYVIALIDFIVGITQGFWDPRFQNRWRMLPCLPYLPPLLGLGSISWPWFYNIEAVVSCSPSKCAQNLGWIINPKKPLLSRIYPSLCRLFKWLLLPLRSYGHWSLCSLTLAMFFISTGFFQWPLNNSQGQCLCPHSAFTFMDICVETACCDGNIIVASSRLTFNSPPGPY